MNRVLALFVLAMTPACMVTQATHTLLDSPWAPEQSTELKLKEGDRADLWIVIEDGERRLALSDMALPPGLPADALRTRKEENELSCCYVPVLVVPRFAEDHLVEVKRAKDWELLVRVPGYMEEPGALGKASAWLLTPFTLLIDTPITLGLGIAAIFADIF